MSSETQREMLKLLSVLKPIEADILRKRFGLVNDRERTLKEIGDEYRLSRERVRQLQEQALGKMRKAMAKREMLYRSRDPGGCARRGAERTLRVPRAGSADAQSQTRWLEP